MRYRRITAAILDIIILLFIASFIFSVFPINETIRSKYNEISEIESKFSKYSEISKEDQDKITELMYETEKEFVKYYLMFSIVLIVYFIIIPYKFKDQTIGQKIRKVRLVSDEKITMNTYVIRAIMNSGLCLTILFPLFIYISNAIWYSILVSILYLMQVFYWVVSLFTLIITKHTTHDKLTHTEIIEVKSRKNIVNKNKLEEIS